MGLDAERRRRVGTRSEPRQIEGGGRQRQPSWVGYEQVVGSCRRRRQKVGGWSPSVRLNKSFHVAGTSVATISLLRRLI